MSTTNNPIFDYYDPCPDDPNQMACKSCNRKVSRGSSDLHKANTTNLIQHLKTRIHPHLYTEYIEKKENLQAKKKDKQPAERDSKTKRGYQQSLEEYIERVQKWRPNDPRSKQLDKKIIEMIALGNYAFTIVNETGFLRVLNYLEPRADVKSDKFYREQLDITNTAVRERVKELIQTADYMSFTSDVWTNKANTASLISLTSHFISPEARGKRLKVILAASPLECDHTAQYLTEMLLQIVNWFEIPQEKIHTLVHDNGRNICRAVIDAEVFTDFRCLAHTLQLAIEDGIHEQRSVNDLLAKSRKIVGHFNRSEQARRRLRGIQNEVSAPKHELKQSVPTRWDSTYFMLERLVEQKEVIALYDTRHSLPETINGNEWKLAINLLNLLQIFSTTTKELSSDNATASLVIPIVKLICHNLQPQANEGGIGPIRAAFLKSMTRFKDIEQNKACVVATFLDPRFRNDSLSLSPLAAAKAVQWLKAEFEVQETATDVNLNAVGSDTHSQEIQDNEPAEQPAVKRMNLWGYFEEARQDNTERGDADSNSTADPELEKSEFQKEMEEYEKFRNTVPKKTPSAKDSNSPITNVFEWWENSSYVILKRAAKKYHSSPPTSVPSEQLFSSAGEIYDDNRYSLLAENAEKLLFLNRNLPLLNYQY